MEFERFTLSNGIPVVVAQLPAYLPLSVCVIVVSGSRAELENEHGDGHFNEHMLFRGGRDFPDAVSVEHEMWDLGRDVEAFTSRESVVYYTVVNPVFLRRVIHLFSDMFRFARIDPQEVEKERKIILEELSTLQEELDRLALSRFEESLFGVNPFGREILGSVESINRLSAEDIKRYKDRCFGPPNIIISVAGPVDFYEVRTLLEEYFSPLPKKQAAHHASGVNVFNGGSACKVFREAHERAHIVIGGFSPSYKDPRACASLLLHAALNRRIWIEVRVDKALVYNIGAYANRYSDIGAFEIYASTSDEEDKVVEVVSDVLGHMADIRAGRMDEEEIRRAKNYVLGAQYLERNGSELIAAHLGDQLMRYGRIKSWEEQTLEVQNITKEDLLRLADDIWREENVRALLLTSSFPRFEDKFCKLRKILR